MMKGLHVGFFHVIKHFTHYVVKPGSERPVGFRLDYVMCDVFDDVKKIHYGVFIITYFLWIVYLKDHSLKFISGGLLLHPITISVFLEISTRFDASSHDL